MMGLYDVSFVYVPRYFGGEDGSLGSTFFVDGSIHINVVHGLLGMGMVVWGSRLLFIVVSIYIYMSYGIFRDGICGPHFLWMTMCVCV